VVSDELRQRVERAMHDAVTDAVNGQHPDLPPLSWRALPGPAGIAVGQLSGLTIEDGAAAEAAAARWADRLRLAREPNADPGSVEYTGRVEDMRVRVWGVIDQEVWESW
jgi:hypothetical protein